MNKDPLVEILRKDFQRKKIKNKSYSLRSYSRHMGLDPSNLSKILNYQIEIGPKLREKIGKKLGFDDLAIQSWLKPSSHQAKIIDSEYSNHAFDVFQVISEWQHYAILEYFKLNDASSNPADIAARLALKPSVVQESLQRLIEVGLLRKNEADFIPTDQSSSSILDTNTSKAHREHQRQILEGAIDALETESLERRSQSSMTMAIDSARLPEAKELIKNFRRDIGRLLSSSQQLDRVYQLSISLYPVSNKSPKGDLI